MRFVSLLLLDHDLLDTAILSNGTNILHISNGDSMVPIFVDTAFKSKRTPSCRLGPKIDLTYAPRGAMAFETEV